MHSLLQVKDLCVEFKTPHGRVRAVDGVDLHLEKGETLGVVGESGCGKSVTSLSIMCLLPKGIGCVAHGEIMFKGMDMLSMRPRDLNAIRGKEISMVFQEPMTSLNPVFKIGKQISEVLCFHMRLSPKEAWRHSVELLKAVGISRPEEIVREYPHRLSGGMLQRVMIAMALACNPSALIADEPTTALDVTIQAQILDLMRDLQRDHNTAILMITHNLGVVAEMCDRVAVMYAGYIVEEADVNRLFDNPTHPYTVGLLECMPRLDRTRARLNVIPGVVPSPFEMPDGCRFAPRCPHSQPECAKKKPDLYDLGNGHKCRCFIYERSKT
jgi:oligopeptide/dipeptide ABC transporter ATP-binding protein